MAAGGTIRAGKRSAPKSIRGRKFVDDEYAPLVFYVAVLLVLVLTVVGPSDDKMDAAQVKKTMLFSPSEGWVTEPILDGSETNLSFVATLVFLAAPTVSARTRRLCALRWPQVRKLKGVPEAD